MVANERKMYQMQQTGQIVQGITNTATSLIQFISGLTEKRAANKSNEALIGAEMQYRDFVRDLRKNPDYEKYGELWGSYKESVYESKKENLSPRALELFEQRFSELTFKYENNIKNLALEKDLVNGVAPANWQVSQAVKTNNVDKVKEVLFGTEATTFTPNGRSVTYHVPGVVYNGYITKAEALEMAENATYQINKIR